MQLNPLVHLLFFLSVLLLHNAAAIGVDFTTPGGGATWPAGPITINWTDAGGNPSMADLTTYTLHLMVGGNAPGNSKAIQTIGKEDAPVSDKGVEDDIQADLAESIQNGFYLMMVSNTSQGNQVINYSDRFTLIQMNGTTDTVYLDGANKEAGNVANVPEAQYNFFSQPATTTSSTTTSATSSPTTTKATSTATSSSSPTNSPDHGTPLGQTVPIIIGGIFAVIGLVSLIIWAVFFIRRARRKRAERNESINDSISKSDLGKLAFVDGKAELPAHSPASSRSTLPRELTPTTERYEMHGIDNRAEAPSEMVFEMEGDLGYYEAGSGRKSKAYDPTL